MQASHSPLPGAKKPTSTRPWPPQTPLLRFLLGGPIPASWEDPQARRYITRPPVNDLDSPAADLFAPSWRQRRRSRTNRKLWGEPQRSAVDVLDHIEARLLPEPELEDDHA